MNSYFILLQRIRKKPVVYLGEKTMRSLQLYRMAYQFRESIEHWEKETGLSFFENFNNANLPMLGRLLTDEFDRFVHAHYGEPRGAMNAETLISRKTSSEDEAFDKYFELYDEFCAAKGIVIPIIPDPPRKQIRVESYPEDHLPEKVEAWMKKHLDKQAGDSPSV